MADLVLVRPMNKLRFLIAFGIVAVVGTVAGSSRVGQPVTEAQLLGRWNTSGVILKFTSDHKFTMIHPAYPIGDRGTWTLAHDGTLDLKVTKQLRDGRDLRDYPEKHLVQKLTYAGSNIIRVQDSGGSRYWHRER